MQTPVKPLLARAAKYNRRVSALARLAANMETLMKRHGLKTQTDMGRASGVSQTHIGNILRQERMPRLDIVEKIAAAFKLEVWQLMLPTSDLESLSAEDVSRFTRLYLDCSPKGRETLLEVAEGQAARDRVPESVD